MTALDDNMLSIVAAFQRLAKDGDSAETDAISLAALKRAETALGSRDVDASFRLALQSRIGELESRKHRKRESTIRVVTYIVTFALGVLATIAADFIMRK